MHPISDSCGIGLRYLHYHEVVKTLPQINWLEIHSENFFHHNNYLHNILEIVASTYPISFHCVSLSLGSTDDINQMHLSRLKELVNTYKPFLISDHLSWSSVEGNYLHDLLPLPYNRESFELFCNKIDSVQNYLSRQILIENPSLYVSFPGSITKEVDFLNELSYKTDCGILLDINNIYISCHNLSQNAQEYLDNIDGHKVKEIHLAGFEENLNGTFIDSHSRPPSARVLDLFKYFTKKHGTKPTLFEQDQNLPSLSSLITQAKEIDEIIYQLKESN